MIGHFLTPFSRDHMTNCGKIHPSKKMRQASSNWLKVSQRLNSSHCARCYFPGFVLGSRKIHIPDSFLPLPLSHSSPDCMHNIVNICFGKCKGAEHLGLVRNLCLMVRFCEQRDWPILTCLTRNGRSDWFKIYRLLCR